MVLTEGGKTQYPSAWLGQQKIFHPTASGREVLKTEGQKKRKRKSGRVPVLEEGKKGGVFPSGEAPGRVDGGVAQLVEFCRAGKIP